MNGQHRVLTEVPIIKVVVVAIWIWTTALGLASAPKTGYYAEGPPSASDQVRKAEGDASGGHKTILVVFGASWCVPCHLLQRYLEDTRVRPIILEHVVVVNLNVGELAGDPKHSDTEGAAQVKRRLGGELAGYPFYAFLQSNGEVVMTSIQDQRNGRPKTNMGFPNDPMKRKLFIDMFRHSIPSLRDAETTVLERSLETYAR